MNWSLIGTLLAAVLWVPSAVVGAPTCRHDDDCDRGFTCADGACAVACRGAGDCPAGSKCVHRACVEQPRPERDPPAPVAVLPARTDLAIPDDPLQACIFMRTEEARVRAKWLGEDPVRVEAIARQRNAFCVRAGEESPIGDATTGDAPAAPAPAAEGVPTEPIPLPQPFGLPLGERWPDPPPAAWQCESLDGAAWACLSPPKPLRDTDAYAVQVHEDVVARATAVFTFEKDAYGVAVRRRFAELARGLAKYGEPQRRDFLREGSIWSRPQDWSQGIHQKERVYEATWQVGPVRIALWVLPGRLSSTNVLILRYEHGAVSGALDGRREAEEADAL